MKKFDQAKNHHKAQEAEAIEMSGKSRYMLIPLLLMIVSMPLFLVYTGWSSNLSGSLFSRLWVAIGEASGSAAVLYSVSLSLVSSGMYFGFKRILSLKKFINSSMKGMKEMLEMAALMMLAFAIGNLCKDLGTGQYVAGVTKEWLSPGLTPAILFITSCFIAFSTGTSWGTFAIMISIAVPLSIAMDLNLPLSLAAVLGGGVFGDHCSPISDTTLISSMASGSDHIDHVRTQLPYALFTGGLSILLYLIIGFLTY